MFLCCVLIPNLAQTGLCWLSKQDVTQISPQYINVKVNTHLQQLHLVSLTDLPHQLGKIQCYHFLRMPLHTDFPGYKVALWENTASS